MPLITITQSIGCDVKKRIRDGRRPDLVGGGLIRSLGGWSAVKAFRGRNERIKGDERILGDGGFPAYRQPIGETRRKAGAFGR